jgi:hypothetical protein
LEKVAITNTSKIDAVEVESSLWLIPSKTLLTVLYIIGNNKKLVHSNIHKHNADILDFKKDRLWKDFVKVEMLNT